MQDIREYLVELDAQLRWVLVVLEILSYDDLALSEDGFDQLATIRLFNKVDIDGNLSELID
jgi:hypothetical protein